MKANIKNALRSSTKKAEREFSRIFKSKKKNKSLRKKMFKLGNLILLIAVIAILECIMKASHLYRKWKSKMKLIMKILGYLSTLISIYLFIHN